MKTRPPHDAHSFEALVERAKASEVPLAPADVDRMFHALQTRVQLAPQSADGALPGPTGQPPATPRSKLGKAGLGKVALGGMGLLAAAALIYNTQRGEPVAPRAPDAAPTSEGAGDIEGAGEGAASGVHRAGGAQGELSGSTPLPTMETGVPRPDGANAAVSPSRLAANTSPTRRRIAASERKVPVVAAASPSGVNDALVASTATSAGVEPAAPAVKTSVVTNDGFDASLERLERAERDLRSGDPKAALRTLAVPVAAPLRSRADALRAVALCQAGKQAEGRELALRHLGRNPSSPYEKRLQSACGKDL